MRLLGMVQVVCQPASLVMDPASQPSDGSCQPSPAYAH